MIRVVASLVARNKSDAEIHDILTGITQVGYTIEQTMKEIDGAIQSARGKGSILTTSIRRLLSKMLCLLTQVSSKDGHQLTPYLYHKLISCMATSITSEGTVA